MGLAIAQGPAGAAASMCVRAPSPVPVSARRLRALHVVLVGHVLARSGWARPKTFGVERHVALLRTLLDRHTRDAGSLVVVEPALQDRTAGCIARGTGSSISGSRSSPPASAPCPALTRDSDWCHEHVPINLPAWLVPIRGRPGCGMKACPTATSSCVGMACGWWMRSRTRCRTGCGSSRDRIVSKGKCEAFLCGDFRGPDGRRQPARGRVVRLDRAAARPTGHGTRSHAGTWSRSTRRSISTARVSARRAPCGLRASWPRRWAGSGDRARSRGRRIRPHRRSFDARSVRDRGRGAARGAAHRPDRVRRLPC